MCPEQRRLAALRLILDPKTLEEIMKICGRGLILRTRKSKQLRSRKFAMLCSSNAHNGFKTVKKFFKSTNASTVSCSTRCRLLAPPLTTIDPETRDTILSLFTVAPLLGQWSDFFELGQMYDELAQPEGLRQFRQMSESNVDYPDFFGLFELVQGRTPPAATWDKQMAESALTECLEEVDDPRLLTWRDFSILRIELQIKTPKGTSEDEERDLSNPAAAFESGEWAEKPISKGLKFSQVGSVVMIPSVTPMPVRLVGALNPTSHKIVAKSEIRVPLEGQKLVVQEEGMFLHCTHSPSTKSSVVCWEGSYTLHQAVLQGGDEGYVLEQATKQSFGIRFFVAQ
eukprot:GABV01008606.1.p1 GENE.GABV01008606.1~~GABV01008606.1.p1  ORF type:complete len:341 (-),score=78.74 GABV01008606.1:13-1035(-)